jgi:hypothetical protein
VALIGELPTARDAGAGLWQQRGVDHTLARTALTQPFALAWEQQLTA